MSSRLLRDGGGRRDADGGRGVREYVKNVGGLYYEARREENSVVEDGYDDDDDDDEDDGVGGGTDDDDGTTDIVDFMHLFSDLVALLSDESLREEILNEVESVTVGRVRGGVSGGGRPAPAAAAGAERGGPRGEVRTGIRSGGAEGRQDLQQGHTHARADADAGGMPGHEIAAAESENRTEALAVQGGRPRERGEERRRAEGEGGEKGEEQG